MGNIIISTTPEDPAIEALRERVRQLEAENEADGRRIAARTMCRDEFLEMIATLTRKLRPRKPAAPKPATITDASTIAVDHEPKVNGVVVSPFAFNAPAPEAA